MLLLLALELNTDYIKARLRRAQCYEREDRLEEALEGEIRTVPTVLKIYQIYPFCLWTLDEEMCDYVCSILIH